MSVFTQAGAVIGDSQHGFAVSGIKADVDVPGFAVPDRVGNCLLCDAIQMGDGACVVQRDCLGTFKLAGNFEALAGAGRQFLKIVHEPFGLHFRGMKAACERAGQVNGFLDKLHQPVCRRRFRQGPFLQLLAQNLACQRRACQMLAQAVVQVVAYAPLFTLARFEQFLFKPPAFLHFLRQCRSPLAHMFFQLPVQDKNTHHHQIERAYHH